MNRIIEVDADIATGEWYVKYEGEWKFKDLTASIFFFTPYGDGRVKKPLIGQ